MRVMVLLILSSLLLSVIPFALAAETPTTITLDQTAVAQGSLVKITVTGENITRVRAAFLDYQYLLVPDVDNQDYDFWGYISAPIDAETGAYRLSVLVFYDDGEQAYFAQDVRVILGAFASQDINLPAALTDLTDENVLLDEFALLAQYTSQLSDRAIWQVEGIRAPFVGNISAVFGTFRRFNGAIWQRHTGIDYPRPLETPIEVAASGVVVYVGTLPIRGNYVLVDHGSGLFTGYAHLQDVYVDVDDRVGQGYIIGTVGNTGRSLGPHLHWEVSLSGIWVDPQAVLFRLPATR